LRGGEGKEGDGAGQGRKPQGALSMGQGRKTHIPVLPSETEFCISQAILLNKTLACLAPQTAKQYCFDLAWINARCPSKPLYHSASSAGQGRGNMMKGSRVKIRTRRDHSPITVTDRTD